MSSAQTAIPTQSQTKAYAAANEVLTGLNAKESIQQLFIQPKLSISSADDPLEKEADDMADKVMRMPIPEPISFSTSKSFISRKCSECEKEKELQRKESNSEPVSGAPSIIHNVLSSSGRSLDTDACSFMGSRFNYDFSDVKVHDNDLAAKSASSINALAYTSGNNIVFNSGQYNANSDAGKRLLAHELTHVVQQNSEVNAGTIQRWDWGRAGLGALIGGGIGAGIGAAIGGWIGGGIGAAIGAGIGGLVGLIGGGLIGGLIGSSAGSSAVSLSSARFSSDTEFQEIAAGKKVLKKGDKGIIVVKLQQALLDIEKKLLKGVDGDFGQETEDALKEFQKDMSLPQLGALETTTLIALDKIFTTRQPYLDNATFDPLHPDKGVRNLSADQKAASKAAMVPKGASNIFQEIVGGVKYGDEMSARLKLLIDTFHKELFEDKIDLRKDPAKNFHDWSVLEDTAEASKDETDKVYGSYAVGAKMTKASGNLIDQWEDELERNKHLGVPDLQEKAEGKVWYLINSNCGDINAKHSAVPSDPKETSILKPIVTENTNSPAKVQTLLELDIGWEGAQLEGLVYLQLYKQVDNDANRKQLWEIFHTCIHEYIHTLADKDFQSYAESFRRAGDETRYNTLIEGFCDFFTLNVRKQLAINDALRKKIEGPYFDLKKSVPVVSPGVYPSNEQAEDVVSIVGIRNAQSAYFKGEVKYIGG